ncbi:hypothetical protein RB195_008802 [Necator americanus]|uniref:Dendritic cell-specific transmembrane protein-like domain-containing protein n=1 Tax=Necator americanus TaxID=51031 RepID=A0ABR1CQH1_NECAM
MNSSDAAEIHSAIYSAIENVTEWILDADSTTEFSNSTSCNCALSHDPTSALKFFFVCVAIFALLVILYYQRDLLFYLSRSCRFFKSSRQDANEGVAIEFSELVKKPDPRSHEKDVFDV